MTERIIVTLTTYCKRISNIPAVLDTIFSQTLKPDLVVLNLAFEELIPDEVQKYIDTHKVEVNRVPDTKVYKKLIPTLKKYPNDCIITIDDDFLYPVGMIEEFVSIHNIWPDHPISGNKEFFSGMKCHCGCASLTKACYYGRYLENIDDDVIENCPSDDLVYTYFATKNGHPYINTRGLYFVNMQSYNELEGYSVAMGGGSEIYASFDYLIARFGKIDDKALVWRKYLEIVNNETQRDILCEILDSYYKDGVREGCNMIYSTKSYKLGDLILKIGKKIRRTYS
jgi:hypothetical protein